MPTIALTMAIIHAAVAVGSAALLGFDAFDRVHNVEAVIVLLAFLIPTGAPTVVFGLLGHRYAGGRRRAGLAMWIAGLTPAGAVLLMMLVGLAVGEPGREGIWAGLITIAIDLLIVFGLRNRILVEHRGPLPVIPIEQPMPGMPVDQPARTIPLPVLPNLPVGIPYETPITPAVPAILSKYLWIFIPVTVLANSFLFYHEQADRSWGAMAIAIVVSPAANLVLVLAALLVAIVPRRHRQSASRVLFLLFAIGLPAFAAIFNFIAFLFMDGHGC
jgi:hypothetical protein